MKDARDIPSLEERLGKFIVFSLLVHLALTFAFFAASDTLFRSFPTFEPPRPNVRIIRKVRETPIVSTEEPPPSETSPSETTPSVTEPPLHDSAPPIETNKNTNTTLPSFADLMGNGDSPKGPPTLTPLSYTNETNKTLLAYLAAMYEHVRTNGFSGVVPIDAVIKQDGTVVLSPDMRQLTDENGVPVPRYEGLYQMITKYCSNITADIREGRLLIIEDVPENIEQRTYVKHNEVMRNIELFLYNTFESERLPFPKEYRKTFYFKLNL